ncbi:MAG: GNAT family N-acetyltransferase [Chlamydiales bacterium]
MNIELKRLNEVDKSEIIELMNHPLVLKHMPLATGNFGEEDYKKFIVAKDRLWKENGYGPWAFFLNETFIGWGGLQPADEDVEVAIVLHPSYWGMGKKIYEMIIKYAFQTLKLQSVIILSI